MDLDPLPANRLSAVDLAHVALRDEIYARLEATRDDPKVTNTDGSNYWGPRITKAIKDREHDGSALVKYIQRVLRKSGESEGWNALLEADRLDLSFEEMVANADEPVRDPFTDEDRQIAGQSLGDLQIEVDRRRDEAESVEVERDHRIVAQVAGKRAAAGRPWTAEMEEQMLAERAARRRSGL